MDWFKKHTDAVAVISSIIISMLWMNGKFNDVDKELNSIRMDINTIKTVLVVKGIYPNELCKNEDKRVKEQEK